MNESHFTIEKITAYFERTLSTEETVRLFMHLESCEGCARSFDFVCEKHRGPASLKIVFSLPELDSAGHLDTEELMAFVEGNLEKHELDLLEHHTSSCLECDEALNDFVSQRQRSKRNIKEGNKFSNWLVCVWENIVLLLDSLSRQKNLAYAVSLLCLLVIGGLVLVFFWKGNTTKPSDNATNNQANTQEGEGNNPANINLENKPTPVNNKNTSSAYKQRDKRTPTDGEKTFTATLKLHRQLVIKDAEGAELIIRSGKIVGAEDNVSLTLREEMVAVLSGKDIVPQGSYSVDDLANIKTRGSKPKDTTGPLCLVSPVNKTVRTTTPTFEWEPEELAVKEKIEYQVSIVDSEFNLVAQSPMLRDTHWKIETPILRGAKCRWQVRAFVNGEELYSSAPDRGAAFKIISEKENLEIIEAEKNLKSHLALSVLYLKAGLLDEAERELRALLKLNQKSKPVKRLLVQVCQKRNIVNTKLRCKLN